MFAGKAARQIRVYCAFHIAAIIAAASNANIFSMQITDPSKFLKELLQDAAKSLLENLLRSWTGMFLKRFPFYILQVLRSRTT
jgi:hypothetical protein